MWTNIEAYKPIRSLFTLMSLVPYSLAIPILQTDLEADCFIILLPDSITKRFHRKMFQLGDTGVE